MGYVHVLMVVYSIQHRVYECTCNILHTCTHTHTHWLWICAADKAYREMKSLKQSQSIIVSGEIDLCMFKISVICFLSLPLSLPLSSSLPPSLSPSLSFSLLSLSSGESGAGKTESTKYILRWAHAELWIEPQPFPVMCWPLFIHPLKSHTMICSTCS